MTLQIDPLDLISHEHYGRKGIPHDAWTTLRREAPVWRCEAPGFQPFWAITKHADIMEISSQPNLFSNARGIVILTDDQIRQREATDNPLASMRTIIEMDPPEHISFRKVTSSLFTPRSIRRLDEVVARSASDLLDSLGDEGECDFIEKVAQRHPLRVLATILGVDRDDEERMLELTQQLFGSEDPDLQREGEDRQEAQKQLGLEFYQLFERVIEDRRANPRDDLASMLANAKLANGEPMGPLETFGYCLIVFTAGHDTTRNALAGGLRAFAENPDQLARLNADPGLTKSAVEEIVRWTSPVNYMRRSVTRDTELRGEKLRAGDFLTLFYASANRDDEIFEDPFRFDIGRHPNRHLGFGTGQHFCLGAHVARASMRALVQQLSARLTRLELIGEPKQIASSFVVGPKTLPVRYAMRRAAA